MRLPFAAAFLLTASLGACRAQGRAVPEEGPRWETERGGFPAGESIPPEVARAEQHLRAGRGDLAEEDLLAAGGISASDPERSWLLVDLWSVRCAVSRARAETAALRDSPMAAVLRAHAGAEPEAVLDAVRPHLSGAAAGWAHLACAIALAEEGGRPDAVVRHAQRAAAAGPLYVRREALLVAAREALEADRGLEALDLARRAAGIDPTDPRPPAFASRIAARVGRRTDAVLEAVEALRLQPESARAARRLADLVRDEPGDPAETRAREAVAALVARRPAAGSPPANAELLALHGLLADRAGDAALAIDRYERGLAAGADPVPVDRRLRRLLFAAGRRREAVALLKRSAPPEVVARPGNAMGPAWRALDAAAAATPDGAVDPRRAGSLLPLARALAALGAVDDAEATAAADPSPAGTAFAARCRAEASFEAAMRARVEEGYRAPASGRTAPSLAALLEQVREAAGRLLPPEEAADFATPTRGSRDVPLLGTWLDHSAATTSPVVAHFRRWGKYLVLGQRTSRPPEAILLSLAYLEAGAEIRTQGRVFHHDLAVGYDREMRSFVDFQGGGLSGATLPDGLWLDADAARKEDAGLRAALRIDAPLRARIEAVRADPPAPDGIDGPFALDDPAGVAYRLVARYVARAGGDPWGSFDVLYAHESGHVLDLRRHLPLTRGLGASAHLLAAEGLSLDKAEARLEGRAQLASVADAKAPDLALVDLVRPLPLFERAPEAHDRGYRDVVVRLLARLHAEAARHPAVDPTRKLLPQLDRLDPEEIRRLAREVAAE